MMAHYLLDLKHLYGNNKMIPSMVDYRGNQKRHETDS